MGFQKVLGKFPLYSVSGYLLDSLTVLVGGRHALHPGIGLQPNIDERELYHLRVEIVATRPGRLDLSVVGPSSELGFPSRAYDFDSRRLKTPSTLEFSSRGSVNPLYMRVVSFREILSVAPSRPNQRDPS
jgi:hypothetical protein